MKITLTQVLLMAVLTSLVSATHLNGQGILDRKVSLDAENTTIKAILTEIEKQTSVVFTYRPRLINDSKKVNFKITDAKLAEALGQLFGSDISFLPVNEEEEVVLRPASKPEPKVSLPANNALFVLAVSGTVNDETGQPLPGVNVVEKGTTNGTTTDESGIFKLNVQDERSILIFSFIGYVSQEVVVGSRTEINLRLQQEMKSLGEVVVIGYGTQERGDITGSISSVSTKSIENQPLASFDQAIAGQAAGVQVSQKTGTPGGGVTVRIRGTGSVGARNEPLYVIDGFPVEGSYSRDLNPLSTLNPNDIESIQILKDASSSSIYGSRGSNGVVIITTKRGKEGKGKIQFDTYYGLQEVANKIDMLNAREYAEYNTEARNNGWVDIGGNASDPNDVRPARYQIPPMFQNASTLGEGTDWQDEIFQVAPIQSYQVSSSSGNENTQYFVSGGYFNQKGVVIKTGFERYSFRFNLDSKISDNLKIGFNLTPTYVKSDRVTVEGAVFAGNILGSALSMPPTVPVYNPDGTFTTLLGASPYLVGIVDNPVAIAEKKKGNNTMSRVLGTLFTEFQIIKDLHFKTSLGLDYSDARSSDYHPSDLGRSGVAAPVVPTASASASRNINWLNENILTYNRTIGTDHSINALIGFTAQKANFENTFLSATNFPNDLVTTLNAGTITSGGTTVSEWSLLSYLSRINYNFKNKYFLTASIRRDGSSRFGQKNKWGNFPSASVGWDLSEEGFMRNVTPISHLKLRSSYGLTGNNNIGNYGHISLLTTRNYVFGPGSGTIVRGIQPSSLSNDQLGWEIMELFDVGLDIGMLNNRLFLVVDYYDKTTKNLLLNVPVPMSTGFTTALQNIGEVSNRGWEFGLNSRNLVNQFKWNTDFNISFNRNEVITLGPSGAPIITGSQPIGPNSHITQIGKPIGNFYGYDVIGVYRDQADVDNNPRVEGGPDIASRPGDLKFRDVNGDGTITSLDLTIIGDNTPDFTYGITNNFSHKNLSLSVLIDGIQGVQLMNGSRRNIVFVSGTYTRRDVLNRWQSPETPGDGKTPRANVVHTGGTNLNVSSLLIEDASFLRIRNIHLRYQFPETLFGNIPIQNAAVYFSVQNAFTFTRYQGYNPEMNNHGDDPLVAGVDFNGYPIARVFTLGLTIGFK